MRNTPCECPAAGWCERHQCLKSEMLFQRCRRDQVMFRAWEDGRGPCPPLPVDETGTPLPVEEHGSMQQPGLAQRVANFGAAAARHVMSGFRHVSEVQRQARLAICRQCPSCDVPQMICREKSCGCYLLTKARWASESCPRGLWGAVVDELEAGSEIPIGKARASPTTENNTT